MSELAINQYGEMFDIPPEARQWVIRRMSDSPRGGPQRTYGQDGRPITVPIDATMDDFHAAVRAAGLNPGKYRLDPLDAEGRQLRGSAYLVYPPGQAERNGASPGAVAASVPAGMAGISVGGAWPLPVPAHFTGEQYLLGEAMRQMGQMNAAMQATVAQQAHAMTSLMTAAAELMRAADGAGLPARKPTPTRNAAPSPAPAPQVIVQQVPVYPEPEPDDEEPEDGDADGDAEPVVPNWKDKLGEVVEQALPLVQMVVGHKLADLMGMGGAPAAAPAAPVTPVPVAPTPAYAGPTPAPVAPASAPRPAPAPQAHHAPAAVAVGTPAPAASSTMPSPQPRNGLPPAVFTHLGAVVDQLSPAFQTRLKGDWQHIPRARRDQLTRWLATFSVPVAVEQLKRYLHDQSVAARDEGRPFVYGDPTVPAGSANPGGFSEEELRDLARVSAERRAALAQDAVTAARDTVTAALGGHAMAPGAPAVGPAPTPTPPASGSTPANEGAPTNEGASATAPAATGPRGLAGLYETLADEMPFLRRIPGGAATVEAAASLLGPDALEQLNQAIDGVPDLPLAGLMGLGAGAVASNGKVTLTPDDDHVLDANGYLVPKTYAATQPRRDKHGYRLGSLVPPATEQAAAPPAPPVPTKVPMGAAMARLTEILPHLTPTDQATARTIAMTMPAAERDALLATLMAAPLPKAVEIVREVITAYQQHGRPFDQAS
ncbi:MAG: hypothetical protein R3B06_07950 [Kofleriaceae bacterium]